MDANPDKDGKPRGTHVFQTITYRATSAEDGSFVDGEASGEAIDYQDKSSGKVMSISFKCFIFQLFCIPEEKNEGDPDGYTPNPDPNAKPAQDKAQQTQQPTNTPPKAAEKKLSPLKHLIGVLKAVGKEKPADVLGWMSSQLKPKTIKATKDLTEAEIAKLTEAANAILKETT